MTGGQLIAIGLVCFLGAITCRKVIDSTPPPIGLMLIVVIGFIGGFTVIVLGVIVSLAEIFGALL